MSLNPMDRVPPPRLPSRAGVPTVVSMNRHLDNTRPRAGNRTTALALLAAAALLLSPLAANAHHHGGSARPGDDAGCSACLWQSQHVAALVAAPAVNPAPTAVLAHVAGDLRLPLADLPRPAARAPPSLHA